MVSREALSQSWQIWSLSLFWDPDLSAASCHTVLTASTDFNTIDQKLGVPLVSCVRQITTKLVVKSNRKSSLFLCVEGLGIVSEVRGPRGLSWGWSASLCAQAPSRVSLDETVPFLAISECQHPLASGHIPRIFWSLALSSCSILYWSCMCSVYLCFLLHGISFRAHLENPGTFSHLRILHHIPRRLDHIR